MITPQGFFVFLYFIVQLIFLQVMIHTYYAFEAARRRADNARQMLLNTRHGYRPIHRRRYDVHRRPTNNRVSRVHSNKSNKAADIPEDEVPASET